MVSLQVRLKSASAQTNLPIPLDMMEDAVDDMYTGCKNTMAEMVDDTYFKKENTGIFTDVWKEAENCANRKLKQKHLKDQALTKNHLQALCAYTSEYESFYGTFNGHIRTDGSIYNWEFPFHSLYFWLTRSVQILNKDKCHTTYRRTRLEFTGEVNQKMRFGFFASSSFLTTLTNFGTKTCFKIKTCFGADLKHYSAFKSEREVLIPPYEVFKIAGKSSSGGVEGLKDCETVYLLKSVGVQSNLNCEAMNF